MRDDRKCRCEDRKFVEYDHTEVNDYYDLRLDALIICDVYIYQLLECPFGKFRALFYKLGDIVECTCLSLALLPPGHNYQLPEPRMQEQELLPHKTEISILEASFSLLGVRWLLNRGRDDVTKTHYTGISCPKGGSGMG